MLENATCACSRDAYICIIGKYTGVRQTENDNWTDNVPVECLQIVPKAVILFELIYAHTTVNECPVNNLHD